MISAPSYPTKGDLSIPRRRLIELMQKINFGRIEHLEVRRGEPILEPPPRIVHEIKIGGENGPRPELAAKDFLLKTEHVELFQHLDRFSEGTIAAVDVRHGLPFKLTIPGSV
jgi:hypothetical protein